MNKKRFTLAYQKGSWWAVKDGDITLWKEETVGLLNALNDENEELKQKIISITEILREDIGYVESLRRIEEVLK